MKHQGIKIEVEIKSESQWKEIRWVNKYKRSEDIGVSKCKERIQRNNKKSKIEISNGHD